MSFKVLFVCAANVCRSPTAVRIFIGQMPEDLARHVSVDSAGIMAVPGQPWCSVAQDWVTKHGVELGRAPEHRSRRLTAAKVERSDLVLATDPDVRAAILRTSPRSRARLFTLVEAVELADAVQNALAALSEGQAVRSPIHIETPPRRGGEARLEWLVTEMDAARGLVGRTGRTGRSKLLDPLDPHGPGVKSHRGPMKLLTESVVALSGAMAQVNES